MRRSIALVLAASLFMVMAEQAQAATVDISIVSASAGFDSKAAGRSPTRSAGRTTTRSPHHDAERSAFAVELRPPERRQLVLEDDQLRGLVPLPLRHPLDDDGHHQGAAPGHPPVGEPGHDLRRRRRLRGRPERVRVRHPAEEGKRRLDGVENRDHVEVRKFQAERVGNVVVPVAPAQDFERREERLVAWAIDLRRLGVLARPRC